MSRKTKFSDDHEQDWQSYPVDPYSAESADHTYNMAEGLSSIFYSWPYATNIEEPNNKSHMFLFESAKIPN